MKKRQLVIPFLLFNSFLSLAPATMTGTTFGSAANQIAYAATTSSATGNISALQQLGIITTMGKIPATPLSRAQVAIILVRLLGVENAVKTNPISTSYTDVPDWAAPYVGYVVKNGLISGISKQKFGSDASVSVKDCARALLLALGYSNADIQAGKETAKLHALGVDIKASDANKVLQTEFYNAVYSTLLTKQKNSNTYLIKYLADQDSINLTPFQYKYSYLDPAKFAPYFVTNNSNVTFADPNLEKLVRETLYQKGFITSENQLLRRSDVVFLQELITNSDLQIHSLKGIEQMPYLKNIAFSHNALTDISSLSALKHCKELNLYETKLTDITPIQGMTALQNLYITGGTFTDLTPLSHLKNLLVLQLSDNKLQSIAGLEGLTSLFHLEMDWNNITDLSPISSLKNLLYLNANYNKISDLQPLSTLTNLRELSITSNQVSSIAPVSSLHDLINFQANYNQLNDLNGIEQMYSLKNMTVDGNQDLSADSIAQNLSVLSDIHDTTSMDNLNSVTVSFKEPKIEQAIRDALCKPSGTLTMGDLLSIYELNLSGLGLTDIQDLANLRNLVSLDLSNNQIRDFSPLSRLNNLTALQVSDNATTQYDSLYKLYAQLRDKDFSIGDATLNKGPSNGIPSVKTFNELVIAAQQVLKYPNQACKIQIENSSLQNQDIIDYAMQLASDGLNGDYTVSYEKLSEKDVYNYSISPFVKTTTQTSPTRSYYQPNPVDSTTWSIKYQFDGKGYSESGRNLFVYSRPYTDLQIQSDQIPASVVAQAKQITAGKQTETEKFNAIYNWITNNIRYDMTTFDQIKNLQAPTSKEDSASVLKSKLAVCSGYATLLKDMVNAVGIHAAVINGLPSTNGGDVQLGSMNYFDTSALASNAGRAFFADKLHAWNAVYVDKKWLYVDPTWDAGGITSGTNNWKANPTHNYVNSETMFNDRSTYMDGADMFYLEDSVLHLNPQDVQAILAKTGITNSNYNSFMPNNQKSVELKQTNILGFTAHQHVMAVAFDESDHNTKQYCLLQRDKQGNWSIVKTVAQPALFLPSDRIKMVINMMIDASK